MVVLPRLLTHLLRDLKSALQHLGMATNGTKKELRTRLEQAAAERRAKVPRDEVVGSLLWRESGQK